jgi:hypothetical protein
MKWTVGPRHEKRHILPELCHQITTESFWHPPKDSCVTSSLAGKKSGEKLERNNVFNRKEIPSKHYL